MRDPGQALAAVDLGSNSFRLVIGRVESTPIGEQIRPIDQLKETIRLAGGLGQDGMLSSGAQARALESLRRFGERLRSFAPQEVRAVATNTFRVARNAETFLARAQDALGFPIEVIPGREEARLIYVGAARSLPTDGVRRLVIDIGGGSTELIVGRDFDIELLESVATGSVALSKRYFADGAVDADRYRRAQLAAREAIEPFARAYRARGWRYAVGTSGTAKALAQLAALNYGREEIDPRTLAELEQCVLRAGHVDRIRLEGLKPDRRPVLPGGLAVMSAAFQELEIASLRYCDGALREGVLYELLGRAAGQDTREATVARMANRYAVDPSQAGAVGETAQALYRQAARVSGPALRSNLRLLGWAAQLHEIGMSISHENFHKHGSYIVDQSDMPGFARHEQRRLAALVLGQTGGLAKLRPLLADPEDWLMVLCLRIASILHRRRDRVPPSWFRLRIRGETARLELRGAWLNAHPLTMRSLALESSEWANSGPFGQFVCQPV